MKNDVLSACNVSIVDPLQVSAKRCAKCSHKQRREYQVVGPMNIHECEDLPEKDPRISALPIWKKVGLAWFVSPPNPPDSNAWYRIKTIGDCEFCNKRGKVKYYRRQYGLFGRMVNWLKSICFDSMQIISPS